MTHLRRLTILLSFCLSLSLASCASENLSTNSQLIECAVAADGTTSDCHPVEQPSGAPGTCVDHDDDGDDDPHDDDIDDDDDDDDDASLTGDTDDDDDGVGDDDDTDDDNDGIEDDDDCDELPGGDDDDADD